MILEISPCHFKHFTLPGFIPKTLLFHATPPAQLTHGCTCTVHDEAILYTLCVAPLPQFGKSFVTPVTTMRPS